MTGLLDARGLRLLLVEDNPGDVDLVREHLEDVPGERPSLEVAGTLADALDLLEAGSFDVVLLDLGLADSQGLDTLDVVLGTALDVPAVVLTGLADNELGTEAVRRGAQDFLPKDQLTGPLLVRSIRYAVERSRSERKLRRSERRFRRLTERIEGVFWISVPRRDGLEYVSPAYDEIWGRPREELYEDSRKWLEHVHPDDRDRVGEAVARQAEGDYDEEYRIVRPDGEVRWIWDRAFPIRQEGGEELDRVVGLAEDVTRRKELETQLRQAQKMEAVGRLAGGIAHDFNNLLTVIRSEADLILMDLEEANSLAADVEVIQDASDRAAQLTRQLLAFGREQILQPRLIDLNQIITGMEQLLVRVLGEDITIETELADGLAPIRVDAGQLEQVVMNLALNARDAMPGGGTLRLETAEEVLGQTEVQEKADLQPERHVRLTVVDTGTGMTDDVQARIFEPFFTTKEERKGSGLGLSMSYGIVKQSGGSIHVESEPGEGTRMTLRFPPVDGEPESLPSSSTEAVGLADARGTVLVVEDDSSVRRVARRILERAGLEVRAVEDAESGLAVLEEDDGPVDLLLTDLVLPGMGGRELVDRVRERFPELPLIVMSGYAEGSPGDREDLPHEIPFIQKPFGPDGLIRLVRSCLSRR